MEAASFSNCGIHRFGTADSTLFMREPALRWFKRGTGGNNWNCASQTKQVAVNFIPDQLLQSHYALIQNIRLEFSLILD